MKKKKGAPHGDETLAWIWRVGEGALEDGQWEDSGGGDGMSNGTELRISLSSPSM